MLLSAEKYAAGIAARKRRVAAAEKFQEPDRVPVAFAIGGSYYCWLFGCDIAEYYANPELQVEVQLKGLEWEYESLRADSCVKEALGWELGPLQEAIVWPAEIERPAGTSPRIVHCAETLDEFLALPLLPPEENPRMKQAVRDSERFAETARKIGCTLRAPILNRMLIHPPLSCLCALMDPARVMIAMYTEPEKLKKALDRCFEAFLLYREPGGDPKRIAAVELADDNITMIGPDAFREFEMPYYFKLKQRYNLKRFFLHTDGPTDQHFHALAHEVGLTSMDIGGFSKLENAVRDMKGKTFISGGLNCKDFYAKGGLTQATRQKALDAIKLAAPGGGFQLAIGGECYVGVNPEAICELVKLVEERGRYPIKL